MTGEEIKRRLVDFARKWSLYDGTERAEAQTFLNELFTCYGNDRQQAGARFEDPQKGKFLDLIWPRRCLIEMKRPSEAKRLEHHREQALSYWRNASDAAHNVPAPRFVVICAFRRFEIWEPGAYPIEPRAEFDLIDLPDRLDALLFLTDREPVFVESQEAVTRQAVSLMTGLYHHSATGSPPARTYVATSCCRRCGVSSRRISDSSKRTCSRASSMGSSTILSGQARTISVSSSRGSTGRGRVRTAGCMPTRAT